MAVNGSLKPVPLAFLLLFFPFLPLPSPSKSWSTVAPLRGQRWGLLQSRWRGLLRSSGGGFCAFWCRICGIPTRHPRRGPQRLAARLYMVVLCPAVRLSVAGHGSSRMALHGGDRGMVAGSHNWACTTRKILTVTFKNALGGGRGGGPSRLTVAGSPVVQPPRLIKNN